MINEQNENTVYLHGKICSDTKTVTKFDKTYYEFTLAVKRLSGVFDYIPCTMRKEDWEFYAFAPEMYVNICGHINTYNYLTDDGKSHIRTYIRVTNAVDNMPDTENYVEFEGYICKKPELRVTPGREGHSPRTICDMTIAVNRMNHRPNYIHVIAWGNNATFAHNLILGSKVKIVGRMQSREYGNAETGIKLAYEVSATRIESIIAQ